LTWASGRAEDGRRPKTGGEFKTQIAKKEAGGEGIGIFTMALAKDP